MKILNTLDLQHNAIINAKIHILASAPSGAVEGQLYYNSVDKVLYVYNGTTWNTADATAALALKAPINDAVFTGTTTLAGSPVLDLQAATKAYVDTAVTGVFNAGELHKFATSVGDASATTFTVTHSLNTRDVMVSVAETATPWAQVSVDILNTTVDTVTLNFATAPTLDQFRVVVIG